MSGNGMLTVPHSLNPLQINTFRHNKKGANLVSRLTSFYALIRLKIDLISTTGNPSNMPLPRCDCLRILIEHFSE